MTDATTATGAAAAEGRDNRYGGAAVMTDATTGGSDLGRVSVIAGGVDSLLIRHVVELAMCGSSKWALVWGAVRGRRRGSGSLCNIDFLRPKGAEKDDALMEPAKKMTFIIRENGWIFPSLEGKMQKGMRSGVERGWVLFSLLWVLLAFFFSLGASGSRAAGSSIIGRTKKWHCPTCEESTGYPRPRNKPPEVPEGGLFPFLGFVGFSLTLIDLIAAFSAPRRALGGGSMFFPLVVQVFAAFLLGRLNWPFSLTVASF